MNKIKPPPNIIGSGFAWRRPTLPGPCGPSTIGARGLNGRVRDGYVWNPSAIATKRGLDRSIASSIPFELKTIHTSVMYRFPLHSECCSLKTRFETKRARIQTCYWISPRPISTGQLHALLHFHPSLSTSSSSRGLTYWEISS